MNEPLQFRFRILRAAHANGAMGHYWRLYGKDNHVIHQSRIYQLKITCYESIKRFRGQVAGADMQEDLQARHVMPVKPRHDTEEDSVAVGL